MEPNKLKNESSMDIDSSLSESKCVKSSYASKVSRRLYSDKETADVFFTFEDSNERVSAHKCVVANASKVFRRILYGPDATNGDILLRKTPTEAFLTVLKFCYLDEVTLKLDSITDVMTLLDYYEMVASLELCGRFWADNWSIENICSAYDWAINLNMTEFQEFCERKISLHSDAVFKTDGFLSCSFDVLDHILSLDSLLSAESVILGACLNWARKQCEVNGKDPNDTGNLRACLGHALYKIRYGSMTHEEFLGHMDECNGLFSDAKDYENVMRLLCGKTNLNTDKFQTEPRNQIAPLFNEFNVDEALEYAFLTKPLSSSCATNKKRLFTVLKTNQPISFMGFQMVNCSWNENSRSSDSVTFGSNSNTTTQISIGLKITERKNENEKFLHSDRITIPPRGQPYFQLNPSYLLLKPNFEYHFQFDFRTNDGNDNYFDLRYEYFEAIKCIKLSEDVTIDVDAENDIFLIKNCKIALL